MGSALQRKGEYGICHRIFLEYSMAYSKIFHKKKNLRYFFLEYFEISKYEISDLTTRMVLAKGKKKKKEAPSPHSLSL